MLLDNFPIILWINLEKSENRRDYMEKLLVQYKLKNIRINAIDGRNKKMLNSICIPNTKISSLVNACTCSHLVALKYFIEKTDEKQVIIFEDDVSFEFLPMIPFNWQDLVQTLPEDFEVIQLAISSDSQTDIMPYLVKTSYDMRYYSSNAYLITRSGATKILHKFWLDDKINLRQFNASDIAADAIICNTNATYSIPIFTYLATESIIHPNHIFMHKRSKLIQYKMWEKMR